MTSEILMNYEAYRKIFAYAEAAKKQNNSEVGGFLQIEELKDGGLLVEDIILPEQTATCGSFEVKNGKWMKELKAEQIPKLKGWWHSHHNMGTFHSGTDNDTLGDKWDSESKNGSHYGVSIVVAFPNKMLAYLQYYRPIKTKPFEVDITIINPPPPDELIKRCEAEVKSKVKKWQYEWERNKDQGATDFFSKRTDSSKEDSTKTSKIISELGTNLDKKEEETLLKLSHKVKDSISGLSVYQLIENGQWDPELYPDLAEELEEMFELEETNWEEEKGFNGKKDLQLKKGECNHLAHNNKNRLFCVIKGVNYTCDGCSFFPEEIKAKEAEKPKETKETPKEETAIQPIGPCP